MKIFNRLSSTVVLLFMVFVFVLGVVVSPAIPTGTAGGLRTAAEWIFTVILVVPPTVWIALVTVLTSVALGILSAKTAIKAVLRSNASSAANIRLQLDRSSEQFESQLQHDNRQLEAKLAAEARERDRERAMSLRREVYLDAAAAIVHLQSLLGQLTNIDYDDKELLEAFAKDQSAIAKIHIVGGAETVEAVMVFMGEYGSAYLELLALRVPLKVRKSAIKADSNLMERAHSNQLRFLAMMEEYNLAGKHDASKLEPIKRQFELATLQLDNHTLNRTHHSNEQGANLLAVSERLMELNRKTSGLLPNAVLAIRNEMEMPLDRIFYEALWQSQIRKMDDAWIATKGRAGAGGSLSKNML